MALEYKLRLPLANEALPGRPNAVPVPPSHFVHGRPLQPPFPQHMELLMAGLGCFWGAERLFWQIEGVYTTAVGYAGGHTQNPTYEEVCSGLTGHTEAVLAVYDPSVVTYLELLRVFWEGHDPTQGMRQGNDIGTQYRSGIYLPSDEELALAESSRDHYQQKLSKAGLPDITTEILPAGVYYPAETYHQDFAAKNPNHGYIQRWDAPKIAALKRLYPGVYSASFQRN